MSLGPRRHSVRQWYCSICRSKHVAVGMETKERNSSHFLDIQVLRTFRHTGMLLFPFYRWQESTRAIWNADSWGITNSTASRECETTSGPMASDDHRIILLTQQQNQIPFLQIKIFFKKFNGEVVLIKTHPPSFNTSFLNWKNYIIAAKISYFWCTPCFQICIHHGMAKSSQATYALQLTLSF